MNLELLPDIGKFRGVLGHHGRLGGALRDADIVEQTLCGCILLEHFAELRERPHVIARHIVVAAEREQRLTPRVID